MNETVSIIIPVYNAHSYLGRCIESVLNQSRNDIELILVDDGSTDDSGHICDDFALKDARVKVIHKTNGGVSTARNVGIEHAQGEYIMFIDNDDYIAENMVEELYNAICSCDAQISIGSAYEVYENENMRLREVQAISDGIIKGIDVLKKPGTLDSWVYIVPWGKIYKKEVFNNVRFHDDYKIHQDEYIFSDLYLPEYKVICINKPLYYYSMNKDALTKQKFHVGRLERVGAYFHRYQCFKKLGWGKEILHIETAGFQDLLQAYAELTSEELKADIVRVSVEQDKEMVAYLHQNKIISKSSYTKRKLFYSAPHIFSKIARIEKGLKNI